MRWKWIFNIPSEMYICSHLCICRVWFIRLKAWYNYTRAELPNVRTSFLSEFTSSPWRYTRPIQIDYLHHSTLMTHFKFTKKKRKQIHNMTTAELNEIKWLVIWHIFHRKTQPIFYVKKIQNNAALQLWDTFLPSWILMAPRYLKFACS